MSKFLTAIFLIVWCSSVLALEKPSCESEEVMQSLAEAGKLTTWVDIYQSYKRFGHCDDGELAESYTHSIAKILSSSSPKINELYSFTKANVEFENFIVRHVSGAVPMDELKKIKCNLSRNCPEGSKELCETLMTVVLEAE